MIEPQVRVPGRCTRHVYGVSCLQTPLLGLDSTPFRKTPKGGEELNSYYYHTPYQVPYTYYMKGPGMHLKCNADITPSSWIPPLPVTVVTRRQTRPRGVTRISPRCLTLSTKLPGCLDWSLSATLEGICGWVLPETAVVGMSRGVWFYLLYILFD